MNEQGQQMSEQLLLDDNWTVYIQDEQDAQPDANTEELYHKGATDRMLGIGSRSCEYVGDDERMAYVAGYCTKRLLSDAEIEADLEEYRDDIADREYWAGGNW